MTILEEANNAVYGERQESYGHPRDNFKHTAELWSAYKGIQFSPEDVAAFMILVKMSREKYRPKRDNKVDIAGYAATWDRLGEVDSQPSGSPGD